MSYTITVCRSTSNGGDVPIPNWVPVQNTAGDYPVPVGTLGIQVDTVTGVTCTNPDSLAQSYKLKSYEPPTGTLLTIEMEEGGGGGA